MSFINLWIYHLFFFYFFFFSFSFFFFTPGSCLLVLAVIVYFALYIELNVATKLWLRELRQATWAAGTDACLRSIPPHPTPLYSLIFICALSFLALNGSLCVCSIWKQWHFLRKQLLFNWHCLKEINQLVSSDLFWGGKKGLSNCWLSNLSLAIFNSLLETYILWEFTSSLHDEQEIKMHSVFRCHWSIPSISNRKRFKQK